MLAGYMTEGHLSCQLPTVRSLPDILFEVSILYGEVLQIRKAVLFLETALSQMLDAIKELAQCSMLQCPMIFDFIGGTPFTADVL